MLSTNIAQKKKEEGNSYVTIKAYREALLCYEEALRLDPNMQEAWLNKGIMHYNLGQLLEAYTDFEQALAIVPEYQKAKDWRNIVQSRMWFAEGKYQDAYKLLKQCNRTARVEHLLIQSANQFKAEIFFGRVDLKLTATNQVKILSISHGMQSLLQKGAKEKLSEMLASIGLPFTVIGTPGGILANSYSEAKEFIKKYAIIENPNIDFSRICNYSGIYCSQEHESELYGNILSLHDSIPAEIMLGDKILKHHLFTEVPMARPFTKVIQHKYFSGLAEQIIQDIPGMLYVIKRSDLDRSKGVWLVRKNQLDEVLTFLLESNIEKSVALCGEYLLKYNNKPEDLNFYMSLLGDWHSSLSTSSIVEVYAPSKFLNIAGKMYDPTMRVSFVIIRDGDNIQFKPLGAYWQIPEEAINHTNLHLGRIATLGVGEPSLFLDVEAQDLASVYEQLSLYLQPVFKSLFTFDVESYRQQLLTSVNAEQRAYANNVSLHMQNALGKCGYMNAALEILDSIGLDYPWQSKIYHERGLVYYNNKLYDKAIEQFTIALNQTAVNGTYFLRGLTYYALGKLKEAEKDLAKACKGLSNMRYSACYEQVQREIKETRHFQICDSVIHGGRQSIDLHGLHVKEAREKVQETLKTAKEARLDSLTIITGIGNHINNNGTRGVLFKALPNWLEKMPVKAEIKSVIQDKGAYEVQFNFNEDIKCAMAEKKKEMIEFISSKIAVESIAKLEQSSMLGDTESQWYLGFFYFEGIGITQDRAKGLQYIIEAAKNNVDSQLFLGARAYDNREYKDALNWLTKAEGQGNLDAAYYLGAMYFLGQGVIRNDKKAFEYLTKSAKNFKATPTTIAAAHSLGDIYYNNVEKVDRDLTLAFEYYLIAAKGDCVLAQVRLAKQYFYGWGTEVDDNKAFYWFKKAALSGEIIAEYYTGYCYETGRGIFANIDSALHWYNKSAQKGDLDAQFKIAYHAITKSIETQDLAPSIAQLEKLVEQEHRDSLFVLGEYLLSSALAKDVQRAVKLLIRAAELKEVHAPVCLAMYYSSCEPCQINYEQAIHWAQEAANWGKALPEVFCAIAANLAKQNIDNFPLAAIACFTRAAQLGLSSAQYLLAMTYLEGDANTQQDVTKGVVFLEQAAKQNHRAAQFELGRLYGGFKNYLPKDDLKFFYYMQQAALDDEQIGAHVGLGFCYMDGIGVSKNRVEAVKWFEKAAQKGDSTAQLQVGILALLEENVTQGIYYLTLAAKQDVVKAQIELGRVLISHADNSANEDWFGQGVYWFYRAALQGQQEALLFFSQSRLNGFQENIDSILVTQYEKYHPSATAPSIDGLINSSMMLDEQSRLCAEEELSKECVDTILDNAVELNEKGVRFHKEGKFIEAVDYYQKALKLQEHLDPNSLSLANTLNNIGLLYFDQGKFTEALEYHQKALKLRNHLAPNSLDVAASLSNIGNIYRAQGKHAKATEYYNRAMEFKECKTREHNLQAPFVNAPRQSIDTSALSQQSLNLNQQGMQHYRNKEYTDAIFCFKQALELQQQLSTTSNEEIATLNFNIGSAYIFKNEYQIALPYLQVANSSRTQLFGFSAQATQKARARLEQCESSIKKVLDNIAPDTGRSQNIPIIFSATANDRIATNEAIATASSMPTENETRKWYQPRCCIS